MISFTFLSVFLITMLGGQPASVLKDQPEDRFEAVANPDNPYDYVGAFHNEGLEVIENMEHFPCVSELERYSRYMQFVQSRYPDVTYSYEQMGQLFDATTPLVDMAPGEVVNVWIENEVVTSQLGSLLRELYQTLMDYGTRGSSPESTANAIIEFEQKVMTSHGPEFDDPNTEREIALLLTNSAIARYSYAYWYDVGHDPANEWNVILNGGCGVTGGNGGGTAERGFGKWLKKAWADTSAFFSSKCSGNIVVELICRFSSAGSASSACCD
jgi:hypothetical protein